MMGFRDEWCADLFSCGLSLSSGSYTVQLSGRLRMPERQVGRIVHLPMTPDEADRIGDSLKEYAKKCRKLNGDQRGR